MDNHDEYNLIGETEFLVEIHKLDVSELLTINNSEFVYNGKVQEIIISLLNHNEKLYTFDIYELNNKALINAGTYTIVATIIDSNLLGSRQFEVTISKAENTKQPNIIVSSIIVDYHTIEAYLLNNVEYALCSDLDSEIIYGDSILFENLYDSHTYYLYIRYKESENYLASSYSRYEISTLASNSYLEVLNSALNKEVITDSYNDLLSLYEFVSLNENEENLSETTQFIILSYYTLVDLYNSYVVNINNQYESISYNFNAVAYLLLSTFSLIAHAIVLGKKFILGGLI